MSKSKKRPSKSTDVPRSSKPAPVPGPSRTLGPVANLERHLPADWWRTLFNSVYLKTDGDVVENDTNTAREVETLLAWTGLRRGDPILDLCCGQGRHSLELARRGYSKVTGQDRSRYLIRLARKRAQTEGLHVQFREGDARRCRLPESSLACVAILGNSFGYFDREEDDRAVLRGARRVLRSNGIIVLDLTDGDWMRANFEPRSWEWIDPQHFVCRERSLSEDRQRLISREVVVHAEKGVIADQFYAERLYSPETVRVLLEEEGFVGFEFRSLDETDSSRGQDLGMMAHRTLYLARIAEKGPVAARTMPFPKVTVLLGDPSLPDPVKRGGQFNPEDIATVQRLKDALGELSGYEFSFLDEHEKFDDRLRKLRPDFVFNLCDEGYWNDASLELHVPALLETMEIPYSGAGPVTLGLCYDKALVRALAASLDIPVPAETFFHHSDDAATLPSAFPALVKPNTGDSSVGITQDAVVHDSSELVEYLGRLATTLPGRSVLIQEFLSGAEYSVGIIGNPASGVRVLPILSVDYSGLDPSLPRILGYESKWDPDSPYWTQIRYVEADLDESAARLLTDYSLRLFERLSCRDYARFDFRADAEGRIKLLEVNPNPGWCWDGKLNLMATMAGLSYSELLGGILEAGQERVAGATLARASS